MVIITVLCCSVVKGDVHAQVMAITVLLPINLTFLGDLVAVRASLSEIKLAAPNKQNHELCVYVRLLWLRCISEGRLMGCISWLETLISFTRCAVT